MNSSERKHIEHRFLNMVKSRHSKNVKTMLQAMSDEELSDHYEDLKQLAMVYRDNPEIRHLEASEVMKLPLHKIEIWRKGENGEAEFKDTKYVVSYPAPTNAESLTVNNEKINSNNNFEMEAEVIRFFKTMFSSTKDGGHWIYPDGNSIWVKHNDHTIEFIAGNGTSFNNVRSAAHIRAAGFTLIGI